MKTSRPLPLVDREKLATLTAHSPVWIRQLMKDRVIAKANKNGAGNDAALFRLEEVLPEIIGYLEKKPETLSAEDAAYRRARREAMQSKSEMLKLELAELRGQLHRAEDITLVWAFMITAVRNKFLGVPTKCARLVAAETDPLTIQRILTSAVHEALVELRADCATTIRARNKRRIAGTGPGALKRPRRRTSSVLSRQADI
jgi:hypothetical protein